MENKYLMQPLEESGGYYNLSFSNRYMNWKRYCSIRDAVARESRKREDQGPIKILDVGCGDGWIDFRLQSHFSRVRGVSLFGADLSSASIDFANQVKDYFGYQGCFFFPMDAKNLGLRSGQFDIVIISELTEHLLEPALAIREIFRVLKKDGLCILTTPQQGGGAHMRLLHRLRNKHGEGSRYQRFEEQVLSEDERKKMKLSSDEGLSGAGYGHIAIKNRKQWENEFKENGFKIRSIRGTGGLLFGAPYLDSRRVLFALSIIADVILEKFPFSHLFSEILIFELRK
jgi:ubiquinone/menaquinone biosynthesis C-methylase UbiE